MASVTVTLMALISILFGILVIAKPKLLSYLVGIYLILVGVLQLLGNYLNFSPI